MQSASKKNVPQGKAFPLALLTASRRPDSVGELSMSASNTSSAPVLTYSRTREEVQEKRSFTKEFPT